MGMQAHSCCRAAHDLSSEVPGDSALSRQPTGDNADGPHFSMKDDSNGCSTNEKGQEIDRRIDAGDDGGGGSPEVGTVLQVPVLRVEAGSEDPASAIGNHEDGAEASSKITSEVETKPIAAASEVALDNFAKLDRLTENGTNGTITNGVTAEEEPVGSTSATEADGVECGDNEKASPSSPRTPKGKDAEEVSKKDARKKQKDTSSTQPRKDRKGTIDASDVKEVAGPDPWRKLKGKDAFMGSDVDAVKANDLDLCKKICRDRGYGAFVVWEGVACFRAQKGSECLANLVDAPQATIYIYLSPEEMVAAESEKNEKAKAGVDKGKVRKATAKGKKVAQDNTEVA